MSDTQALKDGTASGKQHHKLSPEKEDEAVNQVHDGDSSVAVKLSSEVDLRVNAAQYRELWVESPGG